MDQKGRWTKGGCTRKGRWKKVDRHKGGWTGKIDGLEKILWMNRKNKWTEKADDPEKQMIQKSKWTRKANGPEKQMNQKSR